MIPVQLYSYYVTTQGFAGAPSFREIAKGRALRGISKRSEPCQTLGGRMRLSGSSEADQEVSAVASTSGQQSIVPMGSPPWARILRRGVAQFGKGSFDC